MILTNENREELQVLLDAYTTRRQELGVSAPGTCLYDAESIDRGIRVVADGLGGATWSYIDDPSWAGDSQMVLDGGEASTEAEGVAAAGDSGTATRATAMSRRTAIQAMR